MTEAPVGSYTTLPNGSASGSMTPLLKTVAKISQCHFTSKVLEPE